MPDEVRLWRVGSDESLSEIGRAKLDLEAHRQTDFGWLSHFLHRAQFPDEVDFWQPSPHGLRAIPPGAHALLDQPDRELLVNCSTGTLLMSSEGERHPPWPLVILVRLSGSDYASGRGEVDSLARRLAFLHAAEHIHS